MSTPHRRTRGEQGIAIIMTSLCLLPLMVFAAFGVDLASWYSRISYLQKSADAAALAGTVWMPDLNEATDVACESLAKNGVERGTRLRDRRLRRPRHAWLDRHVAPGVRDRPQRHPLLLAGVPWRRSRSHAPPRPSTTCPLPLGSPLNYFGGDRSQIAQPNEVYHGSTGPPTSPLGRRPTGPATSGDDGRRAEAGRAALQPTRAGRGATGDRFNAATPGVTWTAALLTTSAPPTTHAARRADQHPRATLQPPPGERSVEQRYATDAQPRPDLRGQPPGHGSDLGNRLCVWRPAPAPRRRSPPGQPHRPDRLQRRLASTPTGGFRPPALGRSGQRPLPRQRTQGPTACAAGHRTSHHPDSPYQADATRSPTTATRGSGR